MLIWLVPATVSQNTVTLHATHKETVFHETESRETAFELLQKAEICTLEKRGKRTNILINGSRVYRALRSTRLPFVILTKTL